MEGLRYQQKNICESQALKIFSESKSREEAGIELNDILEITYPDFEKLSRIERIRALNEIVKRLDITRGDTNEPLHNGNRFLAEVVSFRLGTEELALQFEFENPIQGNFH